MSTMLDPILLLRSFYAIATGTVLFVNAFPALRNRFVVYGARAAATDQANGETQAVKDQSGLTSMLDYLAGLTVPHSYFKHFYVASVVSSLFWATQLAVHGPAFRFLSYGLQEQDEKSSMHLSQVVLCWVVMLIQGTRRLYESIALAKPSQARMWFVHWVLGIGFYVAMGISIWIEGIPAIQSADSKTIISVLRPTPSFRSFIALPIFLVASGIQHDCHSYLASLKKYTLPEHPAFQHIISPHYLAECIIYVSLAFLAAPQGEVVNKTILMGLLFVAVNLGVTADNSKKWYMEKFGKEKTEHRWRMVPFVF